MAYETFYHEDFYRQIEIIPAENYFRAQRDLQAYNSEEQDDQFGFTQMRERNEHKIETEQLNINIEILKNDLSPYVIEYFSKIRTGYSSTETVKLNTIALGFERLAIYFEYNNKDIIKHIWVWQSPDLPNSSKCDNLVTALLVLGIRYNLILIDWIEELIVRLSSKKNIQKYLTENFNFDYQVE